MELTKEEVLKRIGRLRRLIEWKLTNVQGTLIEKEGDILAEEIVDRLEVRVQNGTYTAAQLSTANRLWKEFKAYVTGSIPDEVIKGG